MYVLTASPSIAGGDSGELVAEGCSLGTAHPPGYPLFTMLIYALKEFLPLSAEMAATASVAYRANLSSGVFTAGAAYLIGEIIILFPGRPHDLSGSLFGECLSSFGWLHVYFYQPIHPSIHPSMHTYIHTYIHLCTMLIHGLILSFRFHD